jgi:hypothetical protein
MYINDTHHSQSSLFADWNREQACAASERCGIAAVSILGACSMHDLLIAIVFVVMIASPAIVAAIPKNDTEDDT